MAEVRVSVIIPAYRCAGIIGRSIDTLMAQTRRPDEIIVVDDGSPDDIATAVAPYGNAIRLIRKANGGAASARNAGIDAATGDIIALLDSDDLWQPHKLAGQLAIFAQYPEVGLISSRYIIQTPAGTRSDYPAFDTVAYDRVLRPQGMDLFDLAMLVWTSVVIFRRNVIGTDRFDTTLQIAEDRDLWVRLLAKAPIYFQSEITATLMALENSLSRADLDLDCRCMLRMIGKHQTLLGPVGTRRWEANVYRRWAGSYLGHGLGKKAIRPALRRLCYQPFSAEGWWVLLKSSANALDRRTVSMTA